MQTIKQMNQLQRTLTTKDLAYLKDELSWVLLAAKKCRKYEGATRDPGLKQLMHEASRIHQDQYRRLLQCLQNPEAGSQGTGGGRLQIPAYQGQLPKVKSPDFNDRDRANDVLATEKYLSWAFDTSTFESGPPGLHRLRLQILQEIHRLQRQVFEWMFRSGWYKLHAADQKQVQKTHQQFANYKVQLAHGQQQGGQARQQVPQPARGGGRQQGHGERQPRQKGRGNPQYGEQEPARRRPRGDTRPRRT